MLEQHSLAKTQYPCKDVAAPPYRNLDGRNHTRPACSLPALLGAALLRQVHSLQPGDHVVPLACQAVASLRELQPLTGAGTFVFPNPLTPDRPLSDNGVLSALRRMGFDNDSMTPHGFRAMARTLLVERTRVQADVIEAQLAHAKSGPLGAAYDRAEFMEQRREMMVVWADYLGQLRDGAQR